MLSLESQELELKALATREGLSIVTILHESMSAKEPGRPVFNSLLSLVAKKKIDAILCWKIDRLTRNPIDGGQIQWLLQTGRIKCIKTFEKSYFPSDNVLLINIEQAMATQYIRDLSTNVKRGNRAKLERGEWPNKAPLGYVNDKVTKGIKVDKKIARYIVKAFELYASGAHSLKEISAILYEEGLRTRAGNKILKGQIHRIISNGFYAGLMSRDGKTYIGNHKPLVSMDLFHGVQDILQGRKHPKPKKHFYHARGLLQCAVCGCALTADTKKGFVYYYCTNGKGICEQHKKYLRTELIEKLISKVLTELKFDKGIIELAAAAYSQKVQTGQADKEAALEKLSNEAKLLAEKELMLVEGFSSKIIREDVYISKMRELESKEVQIRLQIHNLETSSRKQPATFEQVKNVFLQGHFATDRYLNGSPEAKRNELLTLLSNIKVSDQKVISFQFKSPYTHLAKVPKNSDLCAMLALWDDIRKSLIANSSLPVIDIEQKQLREAG